MGFSKEILEHTYIPDSLEHYGDIINYYLIKLHKLFPDSSMLVFEKEEAGWKLINYLKNFKVEPKLMSNCKWAALDSPPNLWRPPSWARASGLARAITLSPGCGRIVQSG